jgi:steroid delta-isomerase-like uncharacterized protein
MSVESNRAAMTRYLDSHHTDLTMLSADVVFTNMATGDEHKGPAAVAGMLNYIYHVAFDADAEVKSVIVTDKHAVLEATFVGKHIAEFAGVPATGKTVRVPLCVVYDMGDGMVTRGRIYWEVPAFLAQTAA